MKIIHTEIFKAIWKENTVQGKLEKLSFPTISHTLF